uniref:Purple acid phosphatase n=1 Tax=Oryza barthii TaxID=65489 RepID=A0A0D3HIB6_9ORYZ
MAMAMTNTALAFFLLVAAASFLSLPPPSLAVTSPYVRPKPRATLSLLKDDDDGRKPEQVHISAVGSDKMRVTWITGGDAPATLEYGTTSGQYPFSATGSTNTYSYVLYHSGNIHDVVIGPLQPSTTYFYRCSNDTSRELSFRTPPASLPFKFVSTLRHIGGDDYDMLLLPGDLSYADLYQPRWDTYGRLVEPLASARPWMELLRGARVDAVFAGHVHAYERFARVYGGKEDPCGAVHVTIGDGGNREGLAGSYVDPQPAASAFREASFGHGRLEVVNATHALWTWHRNDDDEAVVADQAWITSLASNPACNK